MKRLFHSQVELSYEDAHQAMCTIGEFSRKMARSPCHARGADQLHGHVDLLRCSYNVIRSHRALKFGRETRPPAMQSGLVNAPMNWSDIFTAPAALYAFHVACTSSNQSGPMSSFRKSDFLPVIRPRRCV